jgi:hypothetical protein
MSIVDLTDFRAPKMVTTYKSVVPQGHDEDLDAAGILWHVGGQGSVALDITEPGAPKPLASTNADGVGSGTAGTARTDKPWNNFIHHNSLRPNANAFANQRNESGAIVPRDPAAASVANGDVLLVTEEDVLGESCGNEGSFQTWHIPYLDRTQYAKDNPTAKAGGGKMTPLDRWTTEMLETGAPAPASYDCSAHYFDYRDGFVVQGWYGQGMRVLDVRNAKDIKQVGYWFTGATHTWAAYFVPAKWAKGRTLVYTADEFRGMDVLEVALPTTPTATTLAIRAPVLPEWRTAAAPTTSRPSEDYGWACRLPTTRRIG